MNYRNAKSLGLALLLSGVAGLSWAGTPASVSESTGKAADRKTESVRLHQSAEWSDGAHMLRGLKRLDLSDSQKQAVRQLLDSQRETLKSLMERRRDSLKALQALQGAAWDEAQAQRLSQAYGTVVAELSFQHQKISAELRKLLTPEQWQQLQSLRDERRGRDAPAADRPRDRDPARDGKKPQEKR